MHIDITGDYHGCLDELFLLLEKLGYEWDKKRSIYIPPNGRLLVSVGDITDRGPRSVETYSFIYCMEKAGYLKKVRGNHCDKLMRWAMGRKVQTTHGLAETIVQIEKAGISKENIVSFFENDPYWMSFDNGKLIVAHAAWKEKFLKYGPFSKKCRTWCLFAPNSGMGEDGFPIRLNWVSDRVVKPTSPTIVYGHQIYREVRVENETYGIDTGCVFGGKLSCFRWPEREIVQVDALARYSNNTKWGEM